MDIFKIGNQQFDTIKAARIKAAKLNAASPETEYTITKNGKVVEVWVGPVTFMPCGPERYLAYSAADLDSIGGVQKHGTVYEAGSRGAEVGTYLTLFDAAHGLHEYATGPRYRYG